MTAARSIVVEGYVDVIAMSQAGYPKTVAPLGTALTRRAMRIAVAHGERADPVLRRRQGGTEGGFSRHRHRAAVDRTGQEPALRTAARGPGSRRSRPVGRRERRSPRSLRPRPPLAEMLFLREAEGQRFDTPERRAALERRLRELTGAIADETLRRHYQADMEARLANFLGRQRPLRQRENGSRERAAAGDAVAARISSIRARGSASPASPLPKRQGLMGRAEGRAARHRHPGDRRQPSRFAGAPCRRNRRARTVQPDSGRVFATGFWRMRAGISRGEAPPEATALAQERDRILGLASQMPVWWCLRPGGEFFGRRSGFTSDAGLASQGAGAK